MTRVRFLEEAQVEFLEQIGHYEAQQKGLGERFREQIDAVVGLASTHPSLGSPWKHRTRRVFPKESPFSVVYPNEIGGGGHICHCPFQAPADLLAAAQVIHDFSVERTLDSAAGLLPQAAVRVKRRSPSTLIVTVSSV